MTFAPSASAGHSSGRRAHIVDTLIAERAPKLAGSLVWPLVRPLLYSVLDYAKARRMADAIAPMAGRAAFNYVSDLLALKVSVQGLQNIPRVGPCIVVCNHPTGIADGVAVYDALKAVRSDLCFYANADAHRVVPAFGEVLIPVEWVETRRTRERTRRTLRLTREALEAGRCLVIFPAGRLARKQRDGGLVDPEWMASAVTLARKHSAPILPIHVSGPWSTLFHILHRVSGELRDITLFHELLNKRGRAFALVIGKPISPGALDGDAIEVTARLKAYVEHALRQEPIRAFT